MANLHSKRINGHLAFWDTHEKRLVDVVGPDVVKWELPKTAVDSDGTTTLAGHTVTVVSGGNGDSIASLAGQGGGLVITTANQENDGFNIQANGEAFKLVSGKPAYFGVKLKIGDATQTDFIFGLCITDTDLLGGLSDGAYFRKVDGDVTVSAVLEKDSTETTGDAHELADDTYVTLEGYWDGSNLDFLVNGALITRLAQDNLPDDEELTPSLHFLTGEAGSNVMTVAWARAIQIG